MVISIRHWMFDCGLLKSEKFKTPIICVGNITVGGTGKTPTAEMIVDYMKDRYKVAVLSRGYGRRTKGYLEVKSTSSSRDVGDEPLQIKHKFPHITVAVCEDRCAGIEQLLALPEPAAGGEGPFRPQLIILDDAFQHRRVKPSHSIVLVNWHRPIFNDNLLPIGRLRDLPEQIRRAQSVIITKSPLFGEHDGITDYELAAQQLAPVAKEWRKNLQLRDDQQLCFSCILYDEPLPVDPAADNRYLYAQSAIFFTGIASDTEFRNHIVGRHKVLDSIKFPDHCNFSKGDIKEINNWAAQYPTSAVYTTEKDSKRLIGNPHLSEELKKRLFYIPIKTEIIPY